MGTVSTSRVWLQHPTVHELGQSLPAPACVGPEDTPVLSALPGWCQPSECLCPAESPTRSERGALEGRRRPGPCVSPWSCPPVTVPLPSGHGSPASLHHPRRLERHGARGAAAGPGGVWAWPVERVEPGGHGDSLDRYWWARKGRFTFAAVSVTHFCVTSHHQTHGKTETIYLLKISKTSQLGSACAGHT